MGADLETIPSVLYRSQSGPTKDSSLLFVYCMAFKKTRLFCLYNINRQLYTKFLPVDVGNVYEVVGVQEGTRHWWESASRSGGSLLDMGTDKCFPDKIQEVVAEENRPHAHALVPESLASPPYKQQIKIENLSFTSVLTIKICKF